LFKTLNKIKFSQGLKIISLWSPLASFCPIYRTKACCYISVSISISMSLNVLVMVRPYG